MYVVGLTGGIGSGKSTIAELFAQRGADIVDADIVARDVVAKGKPLLAQIAHHFGNEILLGNGELDRGRLRKIIFNCPQEKIWLNALLHPVIRNEMLLQLKQSRTPYVLLVVPLLIENQLMDLCQRILVIDTQPEIQLQRVQKRDGSDQHLIKQIIQSQVDRQTRLKYADDIIENNLPLSQSQAILVQQIDELHHHYLKLAGNM